MNIKKILCVLSLVIFIAGCNQVAVKPSVKDGHFLTTNFKKGESFRYKFISKREIEVDYEGGENKKDTKKSAQKYNESLEMVVSYTPIEVDPYGMAKIKGVCESVRASRKGSTAAIDFFEGKEFTFEVDPTGKITGDEDMRELIKQAGKKAFRKSGSRRVKQPDMIDDFIVSQRMLWDSVSSLENSVSGVEKGHSWDSEILLTGPMVMRNAAKITYTLESVNKNEEGEFAKIKSELSPAEKVSKKWPVPYTGSFQMKGTFGFLRGYKLESLQGRGVEIFDMDKGLVKNRTQDYTAELSASFMFPLGGTTPIVVINQHYEMELL